MVGPAENNRRRRFSKFRHFRAPEFRRQCGGGEGGSTKTTRGQRERLTRIA